ARPRRRWDALARGAGRRGVAARLRPAALPRAGRPDLPRHPVAEEAEPGHQRDQAEDPADAPARRPVAHLYRVRTRRDADAAQQVVDALDRHAAAVELRLP